MPQLGIAEAVRYRSPTKKTARRDETFYGRDF